MTKIIAILTIATKKKHSPQLFEKVIGKQLTIKPSTNIIFVGAHKYNRVRIKNKNSNII